ncbi:hypothetical protein R9X50_00488700 [Acrodontium crateriforme]|uniref:RNA helicase HEL117 n=1 Tax=Acrodontium crateriforme TaxID=150365 RepID=A0AAQ3M6X5_9PEZI|nr:hypothetical protein R9X50_00488700 [Acrodontium crateriforme]
MDDKRYRPSDSLRKRSRSPQDGNGSHVVKRHRSRSPRRESHRHHHHHHSRSEHAAPKTLPFKSNPLDKHDFTVYKGLFAEYLDLQKQIDIDDLNETEVKGRWKSFLGKWNRGELAEGWYDPDLKGRADERFLSHENAMYGRLGISERSTVEKSVQRHNGNAGTDDQDEDEGDDDDGYGPALPDTFSSDGRRVGPTIPNLQDLQHRRELATEDRSARLADGRIERKEERQAQRERLDELVPRAEPGSRERQLEKKRETAAANRSFREAKSPGAEEVGEKDLMGGDDGVEGYKKMLKEKERAKSERELRREEVFRAKAAEREERMKGFRAKEEKTMEMLKSLAKQRFG